MKYLDINGAFPLGVMNSQSKIELTMVARPSHLRISFFDLLVPTDCAHSYHSSSLLYKKAKSDFAGLLCPRERTL